MGAIEVLNPALDPYVEAAAMAGRPASLDGLTVGFMHNAKPMADIFLEELAGIMRVRYGLQPVLDGKPDPSRVVSETLLTSMAARCRLIVTGVGD